MADLDKLKAFAKSLILSPKKYLLMNIFLSVSLKELIISRTFSWSCFKIIYFSRLKFSFISNPSIVTTFVELFCVYI